MGRYQAGTTPFSAIGYLIAATEIAVTGRYAQGLGTSFSKACWFRSYAGFGRASKRVDKGR